MKDYFGREIKDFDLVVSKSTGRRSRMRHGICVDGIIWFEPYSYGGSEKVWINTSNEPKLEEMRLKLVEDYKAYRQGMEDKKKEDQQKRIKKKDFKRFGVYDGEIFLGECFINGEKKENIWISLSKNTWDDSFSKDNFKISLIRRKPSYSFHSGENEYIPEERLIREVKYPKKMKEDFLLTASEVNDLFEKQWDLCRNDKNNSSKKAIEWLKILFDI